MSQHFPVEIRPTPAHRGAPGDAADHATTSPAVLLPAGSANDWMAECSRWNCDPTSLLIFPLPSTDQQQRAVVLSERSPINHSEIRRGLPLQIALGKFLTPFDARFFLPIDRSEADALAADAGVDDDGYLLILPGGRTFVLRRGEGLRLHELLAPLSVSDTLWNIARHPDEDLPRLSAIGVLPIDDIDSQLDSARDDIGRDDPDDLPKQEGESSLGNALRKLRNLPQKSFLKGILKLTGSAPEAAGSPTWINRLEDWAGKNLQSLMEGQNQQLNRLLDLLQKDPDRGLKFALPLSGADQGRGLAPPGGKLSQRNLSFNLSDLFGSGGAVSPWAIGDDSYWKLQQAYREAANRELRLGRYRRAAYIFGKLLGDLHATANSLEQGGFFHEAAALYEKKLNDLEQAAACHRKGGAFNEALRLYRQLGRHQEMADLLRELGREEEAQEAYLEAIQQHLQHDRPIEAANIARHDLEDDEEALRIYRQGWPSSKAKAACVRSEFELLGASDLHKQSLCRLGDFLDHPDSEADTRILLNELTNISRSYPSEEICAQARDTARLVTAARLRAADGNHRELLHLLPSIAPDDLLLRRDTRRFQELESKRPPLPLPSAGLLPEQENLEVRLLGRRDHHPSVKRAIAACPFEGGSLVLSSSEDDNQARYIATHTSRQTDNILAKWKLNRPAALIPGQTPRLIPIRARSHTDDRCIAITGHGIPDLPFQSASSDPQLEIGNSRDLLDEVLSFASTQDGLLWELRVDEHSGFLLNSSFKGELAASHALDLSFIDELHERDWATPSMVCSRSEVFFTLGKFICRWAHGELSGVRCPLPTNAIASSPRPANGSVAVALEQGVAIIWTGGRFRDPEIIADGIDLPTVAYTPSGHLVVAGTGVIELYSIDRSHARRVARHLYRSSFPPLCVSPTEDARKFEVVIAKQVLEFEIIRKTSP